MSIPITLFATYKVTFYTRVFFRVFWRFFHILFQFNVFWSQNMSIPFTLFTAFKITIFTIEQFGVFWLLFHTLLIFYTYIIIFLNLFFNKSIKNYGLNYFYFFTIIRPSPRKITFFHFFSILNSLFSKKDIYKCPFSKKVRQTWQNFFSSCFLISLIIKLKYFTIYIIEHNTRKRK